MEIFGRTAVVCDIWNSLFFLEILLNVPPGLLIHLGCVLALTMGTTTEMPLYQGCVCAGGPGQGHLGRINSPSGNPAPQLTLWLLLAGLQLLMVTSHSLINYVHTDCLESARHLAKGFQSLSFNPFNSLLHISLLPGLRIEPAPSYLWMARIAPLQPLVSISYSQISPGCSIKNYGFSYMPTGSPNMM